MMVPSQQWDAKQGSSVVVTGEPLLPSSALGTFRECLLDAAVQGNFDQYEYCAANGRPVLLGHHYVESFMSDKLPLTMGSLVSVNSVFVSKERKYRWAYTWEELRDLLADGWLLGTKKSEGIKIWFVDSNRNSRREPERILVLP